MYQITSTGLDSLFSINSVNYTSGFISLICHDQGLYLAGASQFSEVSIVNYSLSGFCEWMWSGYGMDRHKGTERISILPDSSIIYIYSSNNYGSYVYLVKLNANGTAIGENTLPIQKGFIQIYPNPVMSDLNIEIRIKQIIKPLSNKLSIYNCKGQ